MTSVALGGLAYGLQVKTALNTGDDNGSGMGTGQRIYLFDNHVENFLSNFNFG